jgi:hypothetical protein
MQVVFNACEIYLCVKIGGDQFLDIQKKTFDYFQGIGQNEDY